MATSHTCRAVALSQHSRRQASANSLNSPHHGACRPSELRRPLVAARSAHAVVEGVRDQQVHAAHEQPVRDPLHLVERRLRAERAAELVAVAVATQVQRRAAARFSLRRLGPLDRRRLVRLDPPPHHVLAGHVEVAPRPDLVAAVRVAAQPSAVALAPLGQRPVPRFLQPPPNGQAVALAVRLGVGPVVEPQGRQVRREVAAEQPTDVLEDAGRPWPHARFPAAAERVGPVGEDAADCVAEVAAKRCVVAVVHEGDERRDGVGVEDVARGRLVLGQPFIHVVQAADDAVGGTDDAVGGAVDATHWSPADDELADHVRPRRQRLFNVGQGEAAALMLRVGRLDSAGRRAAGVHALVVEQDRHLPPRRLVERAVPEPERQRRAVARQAEEPGTVLRMVQQTRPSFLKRRHRPIAERWRGQDLPTCSALDTFPPRDC